MRHCPLTTVVCRGGAAEHSAGASGEGLSGDAATPAPISPAAAAPTLALASESAATRALAGEGASAQSAGAVSATERAAIIAAVYEQFDRNDPAAPDLSGMQMSSGTTIEVVKDLYLLMLDENRRTIRRRKNGKEDNEESTDEERQEQVAETPAMASIRTQQQATGSDGKAEGKNQQPPGQIQAAASSLALPSPALVASPQSSPAASEASVAAATLASLRGSSSGWTSAAAGGSGKGDLIIAENITGEKGYANMYASTIYMPLNDLAKFKGGAGTENGERMKRAKLVAQRPGGQTEVGADGGAASLERQCVDSGLDAENAAKTVVVDISRDPDPPI